MNKLKLTKYKIPWKPSNEKLGLPIRAAVLGDLHNKCYGVANEDLIRLIEQQRPDMIFVVGDMLITKPGRKVDLQITLSLMNCLAQKYPVYYSNGNHEYRMKIYEDTYPDAYMVFQKGLKDAGVCLLENDKAEIKIRGHQFVIHGYELDKKYYKRFSKKAVSCAEIKEVLGEPKEIGYHILLAHNPVFFEAYAAWGADLTLSGHLHGGMVRLPFLGGVISPQVKFFPKYDKGIFLRNERHLVVSAGLGQHSSMIRINNPAELVMVEFNDKT